MYKDGPIIIIEDDEDDRVLIGEIFKKLRHNNEVIFFVDGEAALDYLRSMKEQPFLILSDINMPRINGFELRNLVHTNEKLSMKCIPYLFFTTSSTPRAVYDAYAMSVQGFFTKPNSYTQLEETLRIIVDYWKTCIAPTEYE